MSTGWIVTLTGGAFILSMTGFAWLAKTHKPGDHPLLESLLKSFRNK